MECYAFLFCSALTRVTHSTLPYICDPCVLIFTEKKKITSSTNLFSSCVPYLVSLVSQDHNWSFHYISQGIPRVHRALYVRSDC